MATKKTHEQFLLEINQRNNLFPLEQIMPLIDQRYVNIDTKMMFTCMNGHPDFLTSPRHILVKKSGCPVCGSIRTGNKNTKTTDQFLEKLTIRNTQFSPVHTTDTYKGTHKQMTFVCTNQHTWLSTPISILQGHGCPTCSKGTIQSTHLHSHEQFLVLLNHHNTNYPHKQVSLVDGEKYIKQNNELQFVCNIGHQWTTKPGYITNSHCGCPFCASSKTFSIMAIDWLTSIERQENIHIIHKGNSLKEYNIPGTKYMVDGYCGDTNTVYEFHGNYWHGNPRLFDKNNMNERVHRTYGELYQDTLRKEAIIKELGYNLVVMWEDEYDKIKNNNQLITMFYKKTKGLSVNTIFIPIDKPYEKYYYINQLQQANTNQVPSIFIFEDEWRDNLSLVLQKLNHYDSSNSVTRLHARKCVIKPCTSSDKAHILNANHLQGNDNAQINYGAYYNNELVAVMTFTSPRVALGQKDKTKSKEGIWELSRFCTDVQYRIPGIASKLLSHFKSHHKWTEIYSFADRRWSRGNMYYQLGFNLVATNPPAYFYVVNGQRKHRWNYRKDIIKHTLPNYDATLTEYQNMVNHGFYRVWDCGTLKFSMCSS